MMNYKQRLLKPKSYFQHPINSTIKLAPGTKIKKIGRVMASLAKIAGLKLDFFT